MVLAVLLIAVLPALAPSSDAELLATAESAFTRGREQRSQPARARPLFRAAAESYARLRERGIANADLCHNEGNAWFLAGNLPRAILAYRRGLRLAPAHRGLHESLTFAREQVQYPSAGGFGRPPGGDRPPWLPRLGLAAWSFALLLGIYALSWVGLTRWWMTRRPGLLSLAGAGFGITVVAVVLLGIGSFYESRADAWPVAVVSRDGVRLRRGSGPTWPLSYDTPLPRGVEARLLFRRGDWVQVELSGGEVGWLPVAAVLIAD